MRPLADGVFRHPSRGLHRHFSNVRAGFAAVEPPTEPCGLGFLSSFQRLTSCNNIARMGLTYTPQSRTDLQQRTPLWGSVSRIIQLQELNMVTTKAETNKQERRVVTVGEAASILQISR